MVNPGCPSYHGGGLHDGCSSIERDLILLTGPLVTSNTDRHSAHQPSCNQTWPFMELHFYKL